MLIRIRRLHYEVQFNTNQSVADKVLLSATAQDLTDVNQTVANVLRQKLNAIADAIHVSHAKIKVR